MLVDQLVETLNERDQVAVRDQHTLWHAGAATGIQHYVSRQRHCQNNIQQDSRYPGA